MAEQDNGRMIEDILGLLEPVGDIQQYDREHPHPDARPDWVPGTSCADTPDWACQVCGKPGGH
jgi:hypothetical protein